MAVDWGATGDFLQGIGSIAGAFALVIAAYFGKQVVTDARSQKRAEKEVDHAERVLASVYKLQSALSAIRSPLSTAAELDESQKELEERDILKDKPDSEKRKLIQANVFYQRIRFFKEDIDLALEILPIAKAYFGEEVANAFSELIKAPRVVRIYADSYMRDQGHDPDHTRRIEAHIWELGADDENDVLSKKVVSAITIIEEKLLPIIRSEAERSKKSGSKK